MLVEHTRLLEGYSTNWAKWLPLQGAGGQRTGVKIQEVGLLFTKLVIIWWKVYQMCFSIKKFSKGKIKVNFPQIKNKNKKQLSHSRGISFPSFGFKFFKQELLGIFFFFFLRFSDSRHSIFSLEAQYEVLSTGVF